MSFVNVFGGTTIYPADVAYRALALTANTTLEWPTELASSANILASIMDVTPTGGTHTIRLPAANLASVGETALFFNVGAVNFIIADNGGNTLVTVAPGLAWQVYLTNNVTVNGVWRSTQYGAGTSSATAGSLVGAGIKAIGTTLNQSMPSSSLNTNYTVGVGDRAQVLNWTGGAGTFTLPSAATAGADWFFNVRNSGTGSVTISPSVGGQFINGGASLVMNPGDSAVIFCDSAGFFTVGLGKSAAFAFDFVSIDLTAESSPYTLSGANLNRIAYRFTGTITGNMDVIVPATVQQYWFANETSLASAPYTITLKTAAGLGVNLSRNQRAIVYCDGTNVVDADTGGISIPLNVAQGGTGATTESGARINLGGTSTGVAVFTAASASSARNSLGSGATGDAIFIAANTAAAQAALGTITVPNGGTGATTLTGVVKGNGTSAFTAGTVSLTSEVSGTLPVANGGTGQTTYTNGQLLIGNTTGNTLTKATLTAGSGVSISNGTGSITISATGSGGTVTSVDASGGTTGMTFSGGPVTGAGTLTLAGTLAVANGGTGTTTAFTAGSVVFAGASGVYTQDNANLFWDNANDRLGIGNTSPGAKLDVTGNIRLSAASPNIEFNAGGGMVYGPAGNTLAFATGGGPASPVERMRIDSTGNVGIGTTTPGKTLDLVGQFRVSGSAASGYALLEYGTSATATNNWHVGSEGDGTFRWYNGNLGGGTERMRITDTGNVGIGTSTPAAVLDVNGSQVTRGDASGFVYFAPKIGTSPFGANYDRFEIRVDPSTQVTLLGNVNGGTGVARALGFLAGTNERMRIDTAGNVGIGTSSPGSKLDVVSGAGTDNIIRSIAGNAAYMVLQGTSFFSFNAVQSYDSSSNLQWSVGGNGTANTLAFLTNGANERMRIDSSGNVGIGTTSPGYRLDIASGDTSAGLGYAMRLRSNATATAAAIQFTTSTVSTQNGLIACTDTGGMTIQTDGASSVLAFRTNGSERLRILNTGGITSGDLADAVGYKGVPQNAQTSAYTLALSDMGKHISITTGGVVIPANGAVAFPIGSTIVVYNDSGTAQNISITTDTLRLAGTATTGTRSLAQRGLATCVKVAATEWVVTGNVT